MTTVVHAAFFGVPCTEATEAESASVVARYRIGAVDVVLRSDVPELAGDYDELYAAYHVGDGALTSRSSDGGLRVSMEVRARRTGLSMRRRYAVLADGRPRFLVERRQALLPYLEWAINWAIIQRYSQYCQAHAAVLSRDERAVVLPGSPGSGKTTIAAGLLARGWSYLSDEFALIDPQTLLLHPYPKALCVKSGSFDVVARLGMRIADAVGYGRTRKGAVAFVSPLTVRPDAVGLPCRAAAVVFPQYQAGSPPTLEPISRAEAGLLLSRVSFNLPVHRERGVGVIAELLRPASCFRLRGGELGAACDLIERLMDAQ